jgi:hypothetical protein
MKQIKSQVEFLQRLYLLNETVKSVAERAEVWAKEDGVAIPYGHRLVRSPLAQRVVRDLVYWSWDAANELWEYTIDADPSAYQLLEDLSERSLESGRGNSVGSATNMDFLDLNALELAARTLLPIMEHVFQRLLFEFPWSKTESTLGKITQYVRLVDRKLEEKLYWLGEILEDLGSMIAFDGEVATREDHTEPSICLDEFRMRRQRSAH